MRGKVPGLLLQHLTHGITPAYAGKSKLFIVHGQQLRDHPRVCGEKFCLNVIPNSIKGSPPRMRGKAGGHAHAHHKRRITPAYAGKSIHALLCVPAA